MGEFKHVNEQCHGIGCRIAQHWKLFDNEGKEIKDVFQRIEEMRYIWHGLED